MAHNANETQIAVTAKALDPTPRVDLQSGGCAAARRS